MTGQFGESAAIRYFDVAWLSHGDGPGHRVVLFLQGCHLRCPWCHSPHSQPSESPLLFFAARCLRCGRCQQVCPQAVHRVDTERHDLQRQRCQRCGKCVDACPLSSRDRLCGALALPTRAVTVAALWDILYPQLDLLRHVGGLTVGGGEPLLQLHALKELLRSCREAGIHTAVETCGALSREHLQEIAGLVDCWLFGYRPTPFYVPPDADVVQANLAIVGATGTRVIVRTPVIAGITDLPESLERIALTMRACGLTEIELLPCHRGTSHYYCAAGMSCALADHAIPSPERLSAVRTHFEQHGLVARIVR